jgi:hypothetical protein
MLSTNSIIIPAYQEGSLEKASRAKGPYVWVYRWRENVNSDEHTWATAILRNAENDTQFIFRCALTFTPTFNPANRTVAQGWRVMG